MTTSTKDMKEQVKERYGAIAKNFQNIAENSIEELAAGDSLASASCCGPTCCNPIETTATDGRLYQVADGVSCSPTGSANDATLAQALYGTGTLTDLPETVTGISLGCGDPITLANLKPGETVLDLGSGGGIDCFLAAKAVGPAGRVIGVDMTDSMLQLANKNKAKLGVNNVEFRKGEIENLPVDDNSVDVIISNCVINLSPDKDAVFKEAFRVLKPGARFTVSDMVTEGEFPEQLRNNVNAWAGCISGALDQADYLQKLRKAGFVDVHVESRKSYGLENLDELDADSRDALSKGVDWASVPQNARLYSARIVARKPERA